MTPRGSQKFLRSVFRIGRDRNKFMRPYPRDILFTTVSTGLCEGASSIDPRPRLYTYLRGEKSLQRSLAISLQRIPLYDLSLSSSEMFIERSKTSFNRLDNSIETSSNVILSSM